MAKAEVWKSVAANGKIVFGGDVGDEFLRQIVETVQD